MKIKWKNLAFYLFALLCAGVAMVCITTVTGYHSEVIGGQWVYVSDYDYLGLGVVFAISAWLLSVVAFFVEFY